jgi:hypothetical protein
VNALPRLRARGGCIVEPFVARDHDASALFAVSPSHGVRLLGSTRQHCTASGGYLGCSITRHSAGAWVANLPFDDDMVADASALVNAAAHDGFVGFCGVDAFSYRAGASVRTTVELNARFTIGHLALAAATRARLQPGETFDFSAR